MIFMTGAVNIDKPSVSAIAVIDLANELLDYEVVNQAFLSSLGSEFNSLYQAWKNNNPIQEKRLPEQMLIDLWQQADCHENKTLHNEDLGLKIGMKVNHQAKGVLANWLTQCSSISEAFDVFNKNIALLNPSEQWVKSIVNGQVKLSLLFTSTDYPAIAVDRSLAAMLSWSNALSEKVITPISVNLVHSASSNSATFSQCFGITPLFDQVENCIVISEADFNANIKSSNPYLKDLISQQASEIKQSISISKTLTESVNKLLSKDLATYCHISVTCETLHISRSTLFRKLKIENTNFTKLVKEERLKIMNEDSSDNVDHEILTAKLGFQDINSYYRFRKLNS